MQINLHRRSRPEGVSGAVFSAYSWYFSYRPSAATAATAAQDSPGLLGVRRASPLSPDSGNKGSFGNSFGNRFGNRIFLEPLCFSIDSSISSLLLPMLLKNPQKVSGIGNPMQTICQVRPRPEEFLGPFFPVTAGTLVTSPQRHGGAGHHGASQGLTGLHGASWRHRASRGFMAAQILVARAILVTALVADLVARFSSNSYVFL